MEADFREFPFKCAGQVDEREIREAEGALGRQFPPDYFEFLKRYGGAIVGPYPVFGLRKAPRMGKAYSVVEVTNEYRGSGYPFRDWIIISEDHAGNPIGLAPDGRVYTFDHDFRQTLQIADSFEGYLRKECLEMPD